jgi:hypothetical protein
MAKKIKYSKITIVIFLTVLIWVWADLALDETLPEKSAVVVVDESVDPKLWISFDKSPSANKNNTFRASYCGYYYGRRASQGAKAAGIYF